MPVSSFQMHPTSIHITAVVVEYCTRTGRTQRGVATNWLRLKFPTGDGVKPTVPIYVRKSQFRLPFKPSVPVLMIGPGTGLAPFRGFVQDRHAAKRDGKDVPKTVRRPRHLCCREVCTHFMFGKSLLVLQGAGKVGQLLVAHVMLCRAGMPGDSTMGVQQVLAIRAP